jgi:hypothetical protein
MVEISTLHRNVTVYAPFLLNRQLHVVVQSGDSTDLISSHLDLN